jgi:hypothetical protein
MNLHSLGVEIGATRRVGSSVVYSCTLTEPQLRQVVVGLPVGGEVGLPDVGEGECFREARRTQGGFEIKRGCHGAHGTWRPASQSEVLAWLFPGLAVAHRVARPGFGATVELPEARHEG